MSPPDFRPCPVCGTDVPLANAFCGACGGRLPSSGSTVGHDALIGRVVDGRLRVLRQLGAGGMGAVYLAEHVGIGKRVAIKVLRADLRDNRDLLRRFRREAMAVSKLTDAHTITVFDFGVWKGLVYLVMEYLQGTDLALLLDIQGRLPVDRALRIARQICSSLTEAHGLGVVHRDLKPENIFLTRTAGGDEVVKVLDFGLAKIVRVDGPPETFQTQEGALLGTPYFMAPEQIDGGEVGPATDLYALGALIFLMLTGRHPFEGTSPVEVLEKHLNAAVPAMNDVAPSAEVPAAVEALVRRLLARRPEDRPRDAQETARILAGLLPDAPTTTAPVELLPAARPARAPSSFSTSAPSMVQAMESLHRALADSSPVATRDEIANYERRLVWRRRLKGLAMVGAVGGGLAVLAWALLARAPVATTVEQEPNDDPRQATPIAAGVLVEGHLGRRQDRERSDRDVFAVAVGGPRPVSVELTGVPGIDLVLEGYDEEGKRRWQRNAGGPGDGERFEAVVDLDRLYLVVREVWVQGQAPSENSTDAYTLKVALGDRQ